MTGARGLPRRPVRERRWLATPRFFERPEPALAAIAPAGAAINDARIGGRGPADMARLHAPVRAFVAEAARAGALPVSLAGDCCAALPVLAGLQEAGLAPTLVWLDAHGDFNTPRTSPSGFLGGMPLAMIAGRGPGWLREGAGLAPLAERDILLVGARDLDPLERAALDDSDVRRIDLEALAGLRPAGPVHLHLDTDLVAAEECAAFNHPVPGGPGGEAVGRAIAAFAAVADIRAVSVSGWTGALDGDGAAARLFARILAPFGARSPQPRART